MRPALLFLLAFAASSLLAQPSDLDDLGRVSLSVVTPESHSDLSEAQLSSLRNTVVRMVTANGISGGGTNADIVIFPVVDLYDKRTVEGMRT
ncbi:MAG: hypothetical protein AAFN13_14730, partial [Bacteroidota bacterium]